MTASGTLGGGLERAAPAAVADRPRRAPGRVGGGVAPLRRLRPALARWRWHAGLVDIVATGEIWTHTGASLSASRSGSAARVAVAVAHGALSFLSRPRADRRPRRRHGPQLDVGVRLDRRLDHLVRADQLGADLHDVHDHAARGGVERGGRRGERRSATPRDGRGVPAVGLARSSASIVVPSTMPYLVAGMKVGFGLALKVSVVAEIFGVTTRHRLRHELQPRDPRHPDGLRVGARDDRHHAGRPTSSCSTSLTRRIERWR